MSSKVTTILPTLCLACLPLAVGGGCVRRSVTVNTEPQGALVHLNDEEIGRTPVTVDFLWYGDYDVVARLDGYETLITHQEITPPWYELPVLDFVAEVLYPGWLHDHHEMQFALEAEALPDRDKLLENAEEFRERALFQTQ